MKVWVVGVVLALCASAAQAQNQRGYGGSPYGSPYGNGGYGYGSNSQDHTVRGYTAPSGSYVQPYRATNPNNTQYDNYGTRGNVNPYTGNTGTRTPKW